MRILPIPKINTCHQLARRSSLLARNFDNNNGSRQPLERRWEEWAERETVLAIMRPEVPFIMPETRTYLRDCFDHAVAVLDLVESYREMTNGLMEVYLMHASNRMSEVMKTMAIITVFFMPLSFLAGIYGMNFERDVGNMPELGWKYGYGFFWFLVVVVVVGLWIWLKRKRWI